jgi:multiple sugar transport system ATP-binding protein
MTPVTFRDVTKTYPDGTTAVTSLNLEIDDGELMIFVGPSGCGKTTALRMVGGLEQVSDGEILIGDQAVNDVGPRERDVAMVFQNYALYPHMSVFENIAFPLRAQGVPRSEVKKRVEGTARLLSLHEHLRRRPRHLSGGQRQRVAMGRALVRQPRVFLMDEPLSNLDAKLRGEMRAEITALQRELGVTTIYVTHDQVEAMTMGHRIAVMRHGVLQQVGTPQELYAQPANLFVAGFIGAPPMNLLEVSLARDGDRAALQLLDQRVVLPPGYLQARPALAGREGPIAVGVRPEHLCDAQETPDDWPRMRAAVTLVETLGPERHVHLRVSSRPVLTDEVLEVIRDVDSGRADELADRRAHDHTRAIARFDADARVQAGDTRDIALVADKLRFFDLETGASIA